MSSYSSRDGERRKWQNPEAILAEIGLKAGLTFMDIGCGNGFFAIPAAKLVTKSGMVYGLDRSSRAIQKLEEKATEEGLSNMVLEVGMAEEIVLCRSCADIVFFGIALHDFEDPGKVLFNAREMLKSEGRLIDLDWKKEPMPLGPPLDIRLSENEAVSLIEAHGFRVDRVQESGAYHYLVTAKLA